MSKNWTHKVIKSWYSINGEYMKTTLCTCDSKEDAIEKCRSFALTHPFKYDSFSVITRKSPTAIVTFKNLNDQWKMVQWE